MLQHTKNTSPKEIFDSVCSELANHFTPQGFSYNKSRPKLTYTYSDLKLEISFFSSRSNIAGEYVNLEILPYFYYKKDSKWQLFFGYPNIFTKKRNDNLLEKTTFQIFSNTPPIFEKVKTLSKAQLVLNRSCNIYGINESKLKDIITFIDSNILTWVEKLNSKEGVIELINTHFTDNQNKVKLDKNIKEFLKIKYPELL